MPDIAKASPMTTLTVRISEADKEDARMIFDDMGLDLTTGINAFIKQVIRTRSIPFPIIADRKDNKNYD